MMSRKLLTALAVCASLPGLIVLTRAPAAPRTGPRLSPIR